MDINELKERQAWSLEQKIDHSLGAIDQFYQRLDGKVYVSFSGGKDSTVLYWLARKIYPDIKAVFCNTGNEYPDIVKFVNRMKEEGGNIEIIHPKFKPQEVMSKYGFPLISKEQSFYVKSVKTNPNTNQSKRALGLIKSNFSGRISAKYLYLIDEPYMVSNYCCIHLKKKPFEEYDKNKGLSPILGIMAGESSRRMASYLKRGGCNVFSHTKRDRSTSHPLSIWTEKDIWDCIERYNIPIADIYKKGATRTGCMFCGYGCHFKDDNRLQLVYDLYPKWYNHFMNYTNNGVTYREALRKVLAVNGLYLPDEKPEE